MQKVLVAIGVLIAMAFLVTCSGNIDLEDHCPVELFKEDRQGWNTCCIGLVIDEAKKRRAGGIGWAEAMTTCSKMDNLIDAAVREGRL